MTTIQTKLLTRSMHKPARIKAFTPWGSETVPFNPRDTVQANHYNAARILCESMGWNINEFVSGEVPNGYAFIAAPDYHKLTAYKRLLQMAKHVVEYDSRFASLADAIAEVEAS